MHLQIAGRVLGISLLALAGSAYAERPTWPDDENKVPAYPGTSMAPDPDMKMVPHRLMGIANADLDKVLEFYRRQFPAFSSHADANVPPCSGAGDVGYWGVELTSKLSYDPRPSKNEEERSISEADSQVFMRAARGARPGNLWSRRATVAWCLRPDANRYIRLEVDMYDNTDYFKKIPRTQVIVTRTVEGVDGSYSYDSTVEKSENPGDDAEMAQAMAQAMARAGVDAKSQAAMAKMMAQSQKQGNEAVAKMQKEPPSEKEVGVPLYPGALLNIEETASMNQMASYLPVHHFVYLSTDDPEKIKAFYAEKTGKPAVAKKTSRGPGYEVLIKGDPKNPMMALSVEIAPATGSEARGGMKTVIHVTRPDQYAGK